MPTIYDWTDLEDDFSDTLVIGNGGSIAIDSCFSYRSLLQAARDDKLITESIQKVFDYLETEDFELVMRLVWHAFHVNSALEIEEVATLTAYKDIRQALVKAVQRMHAGYEVVEPHLRPIWSFMQRFDDVLSLNYDLIVYWAMLEGNLELGTWFKDCFIGGEFDTEWERLREPYNASGSTLVFYPHGNLALATDIKTGDYKVTRSDSFDSLLRRIVDTWESGDSVPLFVSEGESKQKERAILRSGYLSTVYNSVMPSLGPTYTVYGWSMSENDDHILRRIAGRRTTKIAISVYRGSRGARQLDRDCSAIESRIAQLNDEIEVFFFESDSAGCWLKAG
jgi:hypothetical protein